MIMMIKIIANIDFAKTGHHLFFHSKSAPDINIYFLLLLFSKKAIGFQSKSEDQIYR